MNSGSYANFATVLHDADDPRDAAYNGDIAPVWNAAVNTTGSPGFAASVGIPQTAASGLRIYERYFYLDTTP